MNSARPDGTAATPEFDTRAGFEGALRWGLETALARRARRLLWVDADFADWPLDAAGWTDALTEWLRLPQRRLVLLAARYDGLPRRQPRFVAWRRRWSHAVHAWEPPDDLAAALPTLLLDDTGVCVHRLAAAAAWRGRVAVDVQSARAWHLELDAVLQRSTPAFPADCLGL